MHQALPSLPSVQDYQQGPSTKKDQRNQARAAFAREARILQLWHVQHLLIGLGDTANGWAKVQNITAKHWICKFDFIWIVSEHCVFATANSTVNPEIFEEFRSAKFCLIFWICHSTFMLVDTMEICIEYLRNAVWP